MTLAFSFPKSTMVRTPQTATGLSFGTPTGASAAASRSLSYGLPSVGGATSQPVSYGPSVSAANIFGGLGNFLSTMTTSTPASYAAGSGATPVSGIPERNTVTVDGGSGWLAGLSQLSGVVSSVIGSSGDGGVMPATVQPASFMGDNGEAGGINPLYIAGAAILAGVFYYAATK